ncbi:MAG: YaeQ family protein [Leptothrix sp. (in: b-proteobacteria)]
MAIRSTIYKAELSVADIDRSYYADHALTLARHPSETEERLMVRILAFALHAHERLAMAGDISTDDEPALWRRDDTGVIEQWIEVGLPDERVLRRACGRANEVVLLAYGGRKAEAWWADNKTSLARNRNLTVSFLSDDSSSALAALAERSMRLSFTVQDGPILVTSAKGNVELEPVRWQSPTRY